MLLMAVTLSIANSGESAGMAEGNSLKFDWGAKPSAQSPDETPGMDPSLHDNSSGEVTEDS